MHLASAVFFYWLMALVAGFALGTVREYALKPTLGPTGATLVELPIILTLLWFGCRFLVRRFQLQTQAERAAMCGLWFLAFLATEFALGAVLRGWTATETLHHFVTPQGALGIAGFLLAAAFPLLLPRR
jgi:hypothetical protein